MSGRMDHEFRLGHPRFVVQEALGRRQMVDVEVTDESYIRHKRMRHLTLGKEGKSGADWIVAGAAPSGSGTNVGGMKNMSGR